MGTKKEAAKEKAIKGGMPTDVADNIFRMQMNDPSRTQNTPGIFKAKDQKVMAMSTMYNTCLLYTSPSPRDRTRSRMPSSA